MKMRIIVVSALLSAACVKLGSEETGLARTPAGDGPAVVWDLQARPLPEIPFPNDIATYPVNDSATGRRVNASMVGPTKFESKIREQLDTLDGFGIYAPITVSFDQPIDPHSIANVMKGDDAFGDDVIFVVNLNPDSPRYGQPMILDLGNGNFPMVLEKTSFFLNDERAGHSNLVFETVNEDLNGNGVLDPGEDTNHDDALGVANVLNPTDDPQKDLMTFYDRMSNTVWIRPLLPLDERSTYAVILTRGIRGEDGSPIRSPFEWVHDLRQTDALRPLVDDKILETNLGLAVDDIAFAWTFTTQSVTADLVEIRRGMEGVGNFPGLAEQFPPEVKHLDLLKDAPTANGSMHVLEIEKLLPLISRPEIFDSFFGGNPETKEMFENGFQFVDYYVAGTFESPYFIREDGAWRVNSHTGEYEVGSEDVTFFMAIPKETSEFRAPFPAVVLMHGYTSNRMELLAWSASFCRYGVALVAIDGPGHGIDGVLSEQDVAGLSVFLEEAGILNARSIFTSGRSKDLNGDGQKDSGGDMWVADFFHTRDMVRQFAVDISQLVRVLRSFDGVRQWDFDLDGDGEPELAGDFNADGVVDLGGPDVTYGAAGGSLGGIMAGVVGATEPRFDLVAAVSGAAGLTDVGVRSTQGGVNEAVTLRVFGPLLVTQPVNGVMTFHWQVPDVNDTVEIPIAALPSNAVAGDRIEVTNLDNGETDWAILPENGRVRMNFPADAGDPIRIVISGPLHEDIVIDRFDRDVTYQTTTWPSGHEMVSVTHGFGVKRQSKEYRRFMSIAEMVIEPGDPIGYARHYFLEPLPILPEGPHRVNFGAIPTIGDTAVPVAAGLAMARAAGLLPITETDARSDVYRYGRGQTWDPALGFDAWYASRLTWDQWREQAGVSWSPALLDLAPTPNDVYKANWVTEGIERLRRFESDPRFMDSREILFDVDDLADGADEWGQPRIVEPLRVTRRTSAGMSFLRIPYMQPNGRHGFGIYEPERQFDMSTYMNAFLGQWFMSRGTQVIEAPCLESLSCEFLPKPLFDPNAIEVPAAGQ